MLTLGDDHTHCLRLYRRIRELLTRVGDVCDDSALEVKNVESTGLLS